VTQQKVDYRSMPLSFLAVAGMLLGGACAQPAVAQETIKWYLPLEKAAELLEQTYAKPVTYEDTKRLWEGEVDFLGPSPDRKRTPRVKEHSLVMPAGINPQDAPVLNAALVQKVVDTYNQQNPGQARFQVLESRLGVHIVPLQVHDAGGKLVAASNPLDTVISVPRASRTASEHLLAVGEAVTAASGILMEVVPDLFNNYYAANSYLVPNRPLTDADRRYMVFDWGTDKVTARDALISLMDGSSSTMSWRLHCGGRGWESKSCFFGMTPLLVGPSRRAVAHDRCTNCQPIPTRQ
jgi:hypothetical protein